MRSGKLFGLIFNILFVLIILLAAVIILAPLVGWHMDTVLSGSMEPFIHVGSLVIVQPVDVSQIHAGDIIAFSLGNTEICHRVVSIDEGPPLKFTTKGDANNAADRETVAAENVVGTVILSIPQAGYFTSFIKSPVGILAIVILAALLLIGPELLIMIFKK